MPGKLYHSNEIMVLLGDNWFAKRSVKQALEVAERRKKCRPSFHIMPTVPNNAHHSFCCRPDVMKMLEEEKKQFQDWEARMAFTEEIRTSQKVRVRFPYKGPLLPFISHPSEIMVATYDEESLTECIQ